MPRFFDNWDDKNAVQFSSWSIERIKRMEKRHGAAVNLFINFFVKNYVNCLNEVNDKGRSMQLIDIGCGSGHMVAKLIKKYPVIINHFEFNLVDASRKMIKLAKNNLEEALHGLDLGRKRFESAWNRFHFQAGAFPEINLNHLINNTTIITSLESFYYIKDLQKAMHLVYELLAPSGVFLMMMERDMVSTGNKNNDDLRIQQLKNEINIETIHFLPIRTYIQLLHKSGFNNVDVDDKLGFYTVSAKKS
ncbi:MAG: class I SAM-dependent methyltransferase [Promethearchaeota archaeon]